MTETKEFLAQSTIHGLPHFQKAGSILTKVAWLLFISAALGAAIYFIVKVVIDYIDQPVVTAVVVRDPKNGVPFPRFIVCTLQRFSQRGAAALGITTREQAEYLAASLGPLFTTQDYNLAYFNKSVLSKTDEIEVVDKLLDQYGVFGLYENVSTKCEEIVTGCRLNGFKYSKCCAFVSRFFTREGPCFYFHMLDDYLQPRPGRVGGFRVELRLPDNEIIPTVFNAFYQRGVFVYTDPFAAALAMDTAIVPVGMYAIMQLQATQHVNLPVAEKPCAAPDEIELKYFSEYG